MNQKSLSLRVAYCMVICLVASQSLNAQHLDTQKVESNEVLGPGMGVQFQKVQLSDKYFCDGITTGDINGDGQLDIVAGPFWYAGPSFQTAVTFYEPVELVPEASPSNSMFSFAYDFDEDDDLDILVLGRVHKHAAYWYENPGADDLLRAPAWKKHFVFERVRGESPTLCDVDHDGRPDLLTHWDGRWGFLSPVPGGARSPWIFQPIGPDLDLPQFYHGEGVGDVNGDKRLDVLTNDGWYEQPDSGLSGDALWQFHETRFSQQRGGAQMFAVDCDGDGDQDVVSALHAHEWGLAWFEQRDGSAGDAFREHVFMADRAREAEFKVAFSQPHALEVADINGDGRLDVVCGKRRWAHGPDGDVEPSAAPVVYWFEHTFDTKGQVVFVPHLVDSNSGVGVQIAAVDVNGDARTDILTASKLGTFLFLNQPAVARR